MLKHSTRTRLERRAGFMDLPGEIRNEIYELAVLNMQKETELLKLIRLPRARFPQQASGYRGLTQLCRQVRREFLPFWQQRHVYVEIDLRDVTHFVHAFYDFKDARALADANGSVEVSLDRAESDCPSPNYVDLLPFLRLMILAPKLQSRFVAMSYIRSGGPPKYISDFVTISRLAKVEKDELRYHFLCTLSHLILKPLPSVSPSAPPPALQICISAENSSYDVPFRNKMLYETGFIRLRSLPLLILFGNGDYCEEFKRVYYLNSQRSNFNMYTKSEMDLLKRRRPSLISLSDNRNEKKERGNVKNPRSMVPEQQKVIKEQIKGAQEESETPSKSGVRDRLRDCLQNWGIRKRKRNTTH